MGKEHFDFHRFGKESIEALKSGKEVFGKENIHTLFKALP